MSLLNIKYLYEYWLKEANILKKKSDFLRKNNCFPEAEILYEKYIGMKNILEDISKLIDAKDKKENIFDGAKFGDRFKTRNGDTAIYHHKRKDFHLLILKEKMCAWRYYDDGKSADSESLDIIEKLE